MLRVAARVAEEHGPEALDRLQWAYGQTVFERTPYEDVSWLGSTEQVTTALEQAELPTDLVATLDDSSWDDVVRSQTREALEITGEDVGTPIIQVADGRGFFGPVISRVPPRDRAGELWDHVVALADFPSFAELKRSLREQPQLPALGADVDPDVAGREQDWHQGRRPEG